MKCMGVTNDIAWCVTRYKLHALGLWRMSIQNLHERSEVRPKEVVVRAKLRVILLVCASEASVLIRLRRPATQRRCLEQARLRGLQRL